MEQDQRKHPTPSPEPRFRLYKGFGLDNKMFGNRGLLNLGSVSHSVHDIEGFGVGPVRDGKVQRTQRTVLSFQSATWALRRLTHMGLHLPLTNRSVVFTFTEVCVRNGDLILSVSVVPDS